jgi:hypothetical protein
MAEVPPAGDVVVRPDVSSLTQGPRLGYIPPPQSLVVSNGTYARVRTKMCYADRREEKLDQLRQYYAANKDYMSSQQATAMQNEMGRLQNSIDPSEQGMSAGPTAAQQADWKDQAEKAEDLERMRTSPIWWVEPAMRKMGMSRDNAHAVSVQLEGGIGGVTKPMTLKEKIGNKPPFKLPNY